MDRIPRLKSQIGSVYFEPIEIFREIHHVE